MNIKRLAIISVTTALGALAFRTLVFGLYVVPSSSMAPTLLMGDYIFAANYAYGYSGTGSFGGLIRTVGRVGGAPPRRGDVVVFRATSGNGPAILVKRLVGLPGDRVQMIRGQLYLNREPVRRERSAQSFAFPGDDEPTEDYTDYIEYLPQGPAHAMRLLNGMEDTALDNTPEVTVPPHSYFFMGDNRDKSDDSRVANVGFVPEENLIARAATTFFSQSPSAHLWEVSKWSWAIRWHRVLARIR